MVKSETPTADTIAIEMEPIFKEHSGTKPQILIAEQLKNAAYDLMDAREAFESGINNMGPHDNIIKLVERITKCSERISAITAYIKREESFVE